MFTRGYILHRLNPLLGTKLGFFLVRSSFLLAGSSFWPKRSGTTTQPLVALFSAWASITKTEMGDYVTVLVRPK